jgi:hypothetical protein
MATSGSFSSSFGTNSKYYIILEWTRNWVDIASNTSNVTVRAYLQSGGSSYTINSSAVKYGTMHINGTDYSFSFYCSLSGNQKKEIYSQTVNIPHNSDGTKSFWMSVSGNIGISFSSGKVNTISTSGTGTLDTIPRTSGFSLSTSTATLGSTTVTINISRASTSFTHNVYFVYGSQTVGISSNAATSCSFVPNISLSSQTPNGTQGWGTIYVETYSGGTHIGTTSAGLTCYVPASVKPSFTNLGAEVVAAGAATSYGYVQGKSKCKLSIWGAAGSYGSTITQCVITGLGSTWYEWQITTGVLYTTGSITFSAYIVDSRGRASDTKTVTISVAAYSAPVISSFSAQRCNSAGTVTDSGTYMKVSGAYSYNTLGGRNSISSKLEYRVSNGSWTNLGALSNGATVVKGSGGIATTNTYDVRLTVSDAFTSINRIVTIRPQFATLDFKAGGTGIAIGKLATSDNLLEVNTNSSFLHPVRLLQGKWVYEAGMRGNPEMYLKIANFTVIAEYCNAPIELTLSRRGDWKPTRVFIGFNNVANPIDARVWAFTSEGPAPIFIAGNAGAYDLYVGVAESWDVITVYDVGIGPYVRDRVRITWLEERVANLPSNVMYGGHIDGFPHLAGRNIILNSDGVVEVGKYLDFHDGNWADDYNGRITSAGWAFITNLAWIPQSNGAVNLGDGNYRWSTVYSVAGINASSDRSLKENIKYINSKARSADQITYSDMYNFVRDDLGLAEYNYKCDEKKEKKLNFIAQDLLVNEDGSDNVVGQMIVKPVPVPTKKEIKEAKAKLEDGQTYEYPTLSYDINTYVSVLAGALKEAIFKIEELTIKIEELESKVSDDDDIHDC